VGLFLSSWHFNRLRRLSTRKRYIKRKKSEKEEKNGALAGCSDIEYRKKNTNYGWRTNNRNGERKKKKHSIEATTPRIIILPEYAVIGGNWISRRSGFAYAVQ